MAAASAVNVRRAMPKQPPTTSATKGPELFHTTHWSMVTAAGQGHTPHAVAALDALCAAYWRPVFAGIRRHGHDVETARDLTQEFFARLLEGNWLGTADRERGRFRSFLLTCLARFLVDEWRRASAQKRGGGREFFSLDEARAEEEWALEPADPATPESAYDRHWAESVIARARQRLRASYEEHGQQSRFAALQRYLPDGGEPPAYDELAAQLGLTVAALKSAIFKIRQRFGKAVRAEIAETVSRPEDVESELAHLLAALGG